MGNLFSKDEQSSSSKKSNNKNDNAANNKSTATTSSSPNTNATASNGGQQQQQASTINSYDRCMLQLKLQRDKLNAASRLYDQKAEVEKNLAKQFLSEGKREKALYCLKRKKAQEVHLDRVQKYLDNIMTMMQNVESKQLDNEVANALKQGADELKALNEHLSLDDIERIMEQASEQINITNEASALLSQNLVSLDEDDEDILNELDALCEADNKASATKTNTTGKAGTKKTTAVADEDAKAEVAAAAEELKRKKAAEAAAAKAQLEAVSVPTGDVAVDPSTAAPVEAEEEEVEEETAGRTAVAA